MNNSIVSISTDSNQSSPFDSIRHYDEKGVEFWLARELMKLLGYKTWQKFCDAIDRAKSTCLLNGELESSHINHLPGAVSASGRTGDNYRLSRKACYWVAMAGDTRKPEIAQAHQYFAAKTREAEVIIPAQNDRIRELELEVRALELRRHESDRQDTRIALHGLPTTLLLEGKSDAVIEIEKPVLEVIDRRNNTSYSGQTLTQIKDFLLRKHGIKFKTGADIKRVLEQKGLGHLIAQTPRSVLSDYVPTENQQSVYDALTGNLDRQMLLGE